MCWAWKGHTALWWMSDFTDGTRRASSAAGSPKIQGPYLGSWRVFHRLFELRGIFYRLNRGLFKLPGIFIAFAAGSSGVHFPKNQGSSKDTATSFSDLGSAGSGSSWNQSSSTIVVGTFFPFLPVLFFLLVEPKSPRRATRPLCRERSPLPRQRSTPSSLSYLF